MTEDDIRRFIFPKAVLNKIDKLAKEIEKARARIASDRKKLSEEEAALWRRLGKLQES